MNEQSYNAKEAIDSLINNTISPTHFELLEQELKADENLREYFVQYCGLHTDLALAMHSDELNQQAMAYIKQSTPVQSGSIFTFSSINFQYLFVFFVFVCLSWFGLQYFKGFNRNQAVPKNVDFAWLVNAQNCIWADDLQPHGSLQSGNRLKTQSGLAEIRFRCGATLLMEGPAELELISEKSVRLLEGKIAVKMPKLVDENKLKTPRFEVYSPQGTVLDLGTEFGVSVSANGSTNIHVFDGEVEARTEKPSGTMIKRLTQNQSTQMISGEFLELEPSNITKEMFTRKISPALQKIPVTKTFLFNQSFAVGLKDVNGVPIGLADRLPGTGNQIAEHDPNLHYNKESQVLELTTTRSDINHQVNLPTGEYFGIKLSSLGFTGSEDFRISAVIPNIPELENFGQFGLFAGTKSDCVIRGGFIKWVSKETQESTLFMVNNNGGDDRNSNKIGLLTPGTDLRLTLQRIDGKYTLKVDNLTDNSSNTLSILHPEYLDDQNDLMVGIFGANPFDDSRKTVSIKEVSTTVWIEKPYGLN